MGKIDRDILLQTLAGYAEVNRVTEAERRVRLRQISDAEAREVFDSFYRDGFEIASSESEYLEEIRLEHHLIVRKAMKELSRSLGFESSF